MLANKSSSDNAAGDRKHAVVTKILLGPQLCAERRTPVDFQKIIRKV